MAPRAEPAPRRRARRRVEFRNPRPLAAARLLRCALVLWCAGAAAQQQGATTTYPTNRFETAAPETPRPGTQRPDGEPRNTQQRAVVLEPMFALEETFTTNANYDRSPDKRSDFVTTLTPGLRISAQGANTSLNGIVLVPIYLYVRTGEDNNRAIPNIHLIGNAQTPDRHWYVEGAIDSSRQFVTALGARPSSAVVNSNNEYVATIYRISPGLRGELGRDWRYDIRDNNYWNATSGAPSGVVDSYTNDLVASLIRDPLPFGGGVEYQRTNVNFQDSAPFVTEVARLRGEYAPDPALRLSGSVGYEDDDYGLSHFSGTTYGLGARWRPTDRTLLDAFWEHRFFGSSYRVQFDHRTPRTVWTFRASRDVSSYPQQLASIPSGSDINALLNAMFPSQFPDPVLRQQAIDALVRLYGLPASLLQPVNLYTQRATLVTDIRGTAGFVGARNNVYFTVYARRDQAIVGQGSDPFAFQNIDQKGASLLWSSRVDPLATLTGLLDYSRSKGDTLLVPQTQKTTNAALTFTLTRPISGYTDVHVGTRYQILRSDTITDRSEFAIFAGFLHRFY